MEPGSSWEGALPGGIAQKNTNRQSVRLPYKWSAPATAVDLSQASTKQTNALFHVPHCKNKFDSNFKEVVPKTWAVGVKGGLNPFITATSLSGGELLGMAVGRLCVRST